MAQRPAESRVRIAERNLAHTVLAGRNARIVEYGSVLGIFVTSALTAPTIIASGIATGATNNPNFVEAGIAAVGVELAAACCALPLLTLISTGIHWTRNLESYTQARRMLSPTVKVGRQTYRNPEYAPNNPLVLAVNDRFNHRWQSRLWSAGVIFGSAAITGALLATPLAPFTPAIGPALFGVGLGMKARAMRTSFHTTREAKNRA